MELIIKKPYIEIFEKILKLFTHICENVNFKLTRNKLELSGSNNLTNELVIHIDKKFFILNDINGDKKKIINGTVKSKDFYNCIFNHKIVKHLRSNHSQYGSYNSQKKNDSRFVMTDDIDEEAKINNNYNDENKSIVCDGMYADDNNKSYIRKDKKWNIHLSKITLKFNNIKNINNMNNINYINNDDDNNIEGVVPCDEHDVNYNNKLEIIIKFKKCNSYFSAILKLKTFNTPMKNYIYKNESIIQIDPTLFLLNLKDLSNERNIFLKNTDNSFIISSLETCDFSLNKERIKREQFFYNNKNICIPSSKTKYFFKNKKFQDHNMSLPLNELKTIINFCSELNLLCLFSTKNFKENLIIYFGNIISYILEKNKNKIMKKIKNNKKNKKNKNSSQHIYDNYMMNTDHMEYVQSVKRDYKYDYNFDSCMKSHVNKNNIYYDNDDDDDEDNYIDSNFNISSKMEFTNNENKSIVFYLSDYTSSDEYNSSMDELDDQIYLPLYDNEYIKDDTNFNYNNIITGCVHFTSYFNISCDFNENEKKYEQEKNILHHSMNDTFVINNNNNNKNNNNYNYNYCDDRKKKIKKIQQDEKNVSSIEKEEEEHIINCYNKKSYDCNYESNNLRNIQHLRGEEEDQEKINNSSIYEDINKDNCYDLMQNIKSKDNTYDKKEDTFSDTYDGMFNKLKKNKSYEDNKEEKNYDVLTNEKNKNFGCDQNGECSHRTNNNVDTFLNNNLKHEEEKEIIYNSNIFEEFNYDNYMRQNEETQDVYKNMEEKIKELDITFENLKKINKKKKQIYDNKNDGIQKPFLVFSLPKSRKIKKRRKSIEHIYEVNKRNEINKRNKRSSKDLLYNDEENKRYDNNSISCRSEENEIISDNYYSLNDDSEDNYDDKYYDDNYYDDDKYGNDFIDDAYYHVSHNKHRGMENMEYMNYFNNIYNKYNMNNKTHNENTNVLKNKKYKNQLNYRNSNMNEKDNNMKYMKSGNEENDQKVYNNYKHFNVSRLSHNNYDKTPQTNQYSGNKHARLIMKNYSSHILEDEIKRRSVNYDNDIFNYKKCKLQKK